MKRPHLTRLKIKILPSKEKAYGSFKPTDEVFSAWERTKEVAGTLKARVIVFQSPASFEPTSENKKNLKRFFSSIERDRFIFTWEPRGRWEERDIKGFCQELDLIHCVDPFKAKPTYGKILYLRLHGIGGYRYKYTEEDLKILKGLTRGGDGFILHVQQPLHV